MLGVLGSVKKGGVVATQHTSPVDPSRKHGNLEPTSIIRMGRMMRSTCFRASKKPSGTMCDNLLPTYPHL
eukprot:860050-Amphidinium_carterae.1